MISKKSLREKALAKLAKNANLAVQTSFVKDVDSQRLMHELSVHQIELEMQNDELLATQQKITLALNRFTELFEFAPISYCTLNKHGEIQSINLNGASMLGMPKSNLIGLRLSTFVEYEHLSIFNHHFTSIFAREKIANCEFILVVNSRSIWVHANFKIGNDRDECLLALTDITERIEAKDKINLAATVFESINEAVMVANIDSQIIAVNPAFTHLTGYSSKEAIGQYCSMLRSRGHDEQYYQNMWHALDTTGQWEGEIQNLKKNGEPYTGWLTISSIYDSDKKVIKRIGLLSDITEKKRAADLIEKQANFDTLTGLTNRPRFLKKLLEALKVAKRNSTRVALFSIDLDQFKDINDSLGHHMGDQLLIIASERLQACIRENNTVARLGGDEFTVVMENLESIESTQKVADRISQSMSAPFYLGDSIAYVSASIGITIYPEDGLDTETLIKNADQAMYVAKNDGRNCTRYFTVSMQEQVQKRLDLTNELRTAIDKDEFWVAYQPIIDLKTGNIHKAESLLRWEHPQLGSIPPSEFIPIAEESGLITDIGNWVFDQAAQQTSKWLNTLSPDFQTSVNMSPAQFKGEETNHNHWLAYLNEINLNAKHIIVEITEGLLMDVSKQVMSQLTSFDTAGIEISIDDFGTGYSSLAYLKKFHIDYLKIDQSFVQNLALDSDNMALCEAIIVLAHKLGLKVIAEGIETDSQRDLLASVNCDYGQGYLFSKPVEPKEFERYVQNINKR